MVEGQSLRYYDPYEAEIPLPQYYQFFHITDPYFDVKNDMANELTMPGSPYSSQSDSDSSLSSVEVQSRPVRPKAKKNEMKCSWKSCGSSFETLDLLASHVSKVHAASGPAGLFYCGWEGCSRNDRGFNARYKMLVHVRTHTNEKPHKCQLCDKSFSRAENLKIHSRSHSGEKPYICPVPGCNKAYSNSSDRFKHTRTHQVEKPYQCKVPGCTKRYTDPSSLRKHVKTYKHFINDISTSQETQTVMEESFRNCENDKRLLCQSTLEAHQIISYEDSYQNIENDHSCNCNFACCKRIDTFSDSMRFDALINLKKSEDVQSLKWNTFIDPYLCDAGHVQSMDVDMPLDLSMRRKHI